MDDARRIAASVLDRCEAADGYSNIALDTAIKRHALSDVDRAFLTALVYGVLERRLTLDACIDSLTSGRVGDISPEVRTALRLGLYQMAFMDRVPDHAAVNESVSMVPRRARGFVNAILREFSRRGKTFPCPAREDRPVSYLSVKYSFSESIAARFLAAYGMERTEALFSAFSKEPPLTLRVNTLRVTRDELMETYASSGIRAEKTAGSEGGIRILDKIPVTQLYGFSEGFFFVQDEASQLAVRALDARVGMRVLDTCACPGSKSFGVAIDMEDRGEVLSCDLHANKLSLVSAGASRLGITSIRTLAADARVTREELVGSFDRVLCDVPCSGFGVFSKKPELRYKDATHSDALPAIQSDILENASRYVKDGGRLIYSTCTLLPAENGENVAKFLSRHAEFSLLEERTLYPDTDMTDGFYFAVMEKRS
ncbi:MAG: 16S rRNA (cytosine(967)-C(5))-methyltransferase RsmB [Ruminococcaceae bacterium]|nr:16S rRNA (cytosine(967)-C(5))-methyltransferase RsmB [Oscillospiraceae bacterium]